MVNRSAGIHVGPRQRVGNRGTDEMFSLRDILDVFLVNWKWFLLSVVVCVGFSRLYLASCSNVYQRQAVMLVKDDASGSGGRRSNISTDALMQLNGVLSGTSVKNEVYILHSFQLSQEVAKNLHLDVMYSCKNRLRNISLYNDRPVTVDFLQPFLERVTFSMDIKSAQECTIHDVKMGSPLTESSFRCDVRMGQTLKTPFGQLVVTPIKENMEEFIGKTITVTRVSIDDAAIMILNKCTSGELDKESTLVRITCNDTNIERADDILSGLLDAYKRSIIEDKNKMAQSTAAFIDSRIQLIHQELSEVEGKMAEFKQNSGLVDIKANSDAFLTQSTTARQRTIQAEMQYSMVQYLMDYLTENSKGNALIPTMGGISDNGIQTQIARYNELMLNRNRLAENTSETSPTIKELDSNLSQMYATILASLKGYTASLKLQFDKAKAEESGIRGTINTVPQKEKQVIDIARQQTIKETLYTFLLNKREETALQLAITEANIRIVEHPFGSSGPIAPRTKVIILISLILGIAIPSIFFQIKEWLNMGVRGRKDVEAYTTIPILGEIPHRKDGMSDSDIVVSAHGDDAIGEAFRLLRFSMTFINKDACVIMFTSTIPGEGKTFISRNFAATLGMAGKKVVLVDTDIRKRTQSKLSSKGRSQGLTSYLSGAVDDINSLVLQQGDACNLYFLPAGITPPNPAELLMSDRLEQCMEELKKHYDYIVVDNVPAQVVADAGIVNRIADLTIYVIREGKIDRRYLPELERLHQEGKFNHLCIVLNDCPNRNRKYGYGYGYASEEKEKSWRSKLLGRSSRIS
ncbi:MAG: polysaccharide biosynthesis tyrosine autokinase [Bacteroidaceae bacterium]|nr:polysaccharide biosynthesis tyrosine autokinase [Bacteroidaceae bacterium]